PVPVDLLVVGTVPAGCELPSSTVVVTLTLAFLAANNRLGNVKNCAAIWGNRKRVCRSKQRRYVLCYHGAAFENTDGMADWTWLFLSSLVTGFYILCQLLPRPGAAVVLASLGVTSEKFVHARMCSNLRVVNLATARILVRHLDVDVGSCELVTLR
ncbi:hypothetical protein EDB86DRAFT_2770511, partial [Lactarius hatsudake]